MGNSKGSSRHGKVCVGNANNGNHDSGTGSSVGGNTSEILSIQGPSIQNNHKNQEHTMIGGMFHG